MRKIELPKPVVDYRKFKFSEINDPEFSHVKLLIGWPIYLAFYFLTENFIPEERLHVVHSAVDDMIPFDERFLVFYCFWFVLLLFSLLYFFLYDTQKFRELQTFIMITQVIAMATYIIYPTVQHLRPAVMPNNGFLCNLMKFIYAFDTPTGVCPSLHVAYSMGIASVWSKYKEGALSWRIFVVVVTIMISISVLFVKQHSFTDVLAAIPVGFIAEYIVYGNLHAERRKKIEEMLSE